MAYITTSYGRPIQGVSQQPDRIRLEGQCTLQENFIPDVVKGLTRRPSTYLVKKLLDRNTNRDNRFHSYDRGDEAYMMFVEPNSTVVKVYGADGKEHIVNGTNAYLNVPNPRLQLEMRTIGDYTFITNKTVPVTMASTKSEKHYPIGVVYCQFATYSRTYQIFIDGAPVATLTTPDGSIPSHLAAVATDRIASDLYVQLDKDKYEVTLDINCIIISKKDKTDFTVTTSDSQKGDDLIAVKGAVRSVTQLPPLAPIGMIIRITGEGKSTKDDYWLKSTLVSGETKLRWVETVEPDILIAFNKTTMPHVLVRESIDGNGVATFTLREGEWTNRVVGGVESNPTPSFIDEDNPIPIQSCGVFQNRLFFLAGETWMASRSNLFFNFWKETSQVSVDSDPLDGYADTDRVNNLHTYQILNGDLAIFADEAQFVIKGDSPVTKSNLTLQQVTSYPNNIEVSPQAAGENVFFAYDSSGYTGIRELFTDNFSDTKKAFPITDYVSKYLNGKCIQLLASPNFNTMMVRTDKDLSKVYVYDWLWQGEQKVQSAWHSWVFDGEVLYLFYLEDKMYVVYQVDDELRMDYLFMVNDPASEGLVFSVSLDHKVNVTSTRKPTTNTFAFTLPYSVDNAVCTISSGGSVVDMGTAITYRNLGDGNYETDDYLTDNDSCTLLCGIPYKSRYIPTQPTVKDARDRVIGLDSIIISNIYIHYEVTGFLGVNIKPANAQSRDYSFYGRYMGSDANLIGAPTLVNGTYRAPVRQRAEELLLTINTDSHYPLTVRDLELDGTFHQRGQRI